MNLQEFKIQTKALFERGAEIHAYQQPIEDYFGDKPIPLVTVNYPFLARARINYEGEVFNHKDQLSYNPKMEKIALQRANLPGQQVFYACPPSEGQTLQCHNIAILETTLDHLDNNNQLRTYLTVSRWIPKRPLNVAVLPFAMTSCERNRDCSKATHEYELILNQCRPHLREGAFEEFKEGLNYVSELFCQRTEREYCYRITANYFNYIMSVTQANGLPLDGLLYPSANSQATGLNLALNKLLIDNNSIEMDHVFMTVIQRHPTHIKEITFAPASNHGKLNVDGSFVINGIK
jgi:hypothetical protein